MTTMTTTMNRCEDNAAMIMFYTLIALHTTTTTKVTSIARDGGVPLYYKSDINKLLAIQAMELDQ